MVMWYPEILNAMSKYMENTERNDVMLCSALKEDIETKIIDEVLDKVNKSFL